MCATEARVIGYYSGVQGMGVASGATEVEERRRILGVQRLLEIDRMHPRNGFCTASALEVEDRSRIAGDANDGCEGRG